MTQYSSYTNKTVSYMQEYLYVFHETKDMFLHFRTGKKTKKAAALIRFKENEYLKLFESLRSSNT